MNNYRGWTIAYYAGQIEPRRYSAEQFNRRSGATITLHASSRDEIEKTVDDYIKANAPLGGRDVEILI